MTTRSWNKSSVGRKISVLGALVSSLILAVLVGCEVDSFLDPSVVGRWERTPVVLPILDRLDVIEESNAEAKYFVKLHLTSKYFEDSS